MKGEIFFYYCAHVDEAEAHVGIEDSFLGLVLSFHLCMAPRGWTQASGLRGKSLYWPNHLARPSEVFWWVASILLPNRILDLGQGLCSPSSVCPRLFHVMPHCPSMVSRAFEIGNRGSPPDKRLNFWMPEAVGGTGGQGVEISPTAPHHLVCLCLCLFSPEVLTI